MGSENSKQSRVGDPEAEFGLGREYHVEISNDFREGAGDLQNDQK